MSGSVDDDDETVDDQFNYIRTQLDDKGRSILKEMESFLKGSSVTLLYILRTLTGNPSISESQKQHMISMIIL